MADEIISRAEAQARGLKRYFTGIPCSQGHIAERMVSSCNCIPCKEIRFKRWFSANKAKHSAYGSEWSRRNREKLRDKEKQRAKNFRSKYPERSKAAVKKWQSSNPEKMRSYVRNRWAMKKACGGSHTAEEIVALLERQKWKCIYCGSSIKKKRNIDHIVPLYLGGSNDIGNLQGLCPPCNRRKSAKDPIEFAKELGFLV